METPHGSEPQTVDTPGAGAAPRTITRGLGADSARRGAQRQLHSRAPKPPAAGPHEAAAVGLWIDHRKAVLVFVTPGGVETTLVLSCVDRPPGRAGRIRTAEPIARRRLPAVGRRERRHTAGLDLYYDAVIACLRGMRSILAFGPGEAWGELRRRLARNKHDRRVFAFEVADKMTGRQIAAKTMDWMETTRGATPPPRRRSGRPER